MIYLLELTYDETVERLDIKNTAGSTIGYTSAPRVSEIIDFNLMLKSLLPNDLKVIFYN